MQSLAVRYDADSRLGAALAVTRNGYRDAAKTDGHPRSAENIASLALGWHEFLAFGERIGAITDAERAACWSRAWSALCAVGAEQESYAADSDPVGIYLGSVRALIASGRVHVAGQDGGCPPENPVRWGWAEGMSGGEPCGARRATWSAGSTEMISTLSPASPTSWHGSTPRPRGSR